MRESPSIQNYEHVFGPEATAAMGTALEDICNTLRINGNAAARDIIATRILELARRGMRDPKTIYARILNEAEGSGV
jgi:hypothetical protein